jgi:hypothetical protein
MTVCNKANKPVCNKANKSVCNKANKPVCKRGHTHHQIYQAQKQQSLNQSLLHNTGSKSKSKSNQRQLLVCTSVYSANTKLSDTSDLKKWTNSKSKSKDNYKSVYCTFIFLSLFLSLFLFNNSTTRKYISKKSITLCQSGGDETSIDDLWPVSQPRPKL